MAPRQPMSAIPRVIGASVLGLLGALATAALAGPELGVLVGITLSSGVFVVVGWVVLWPMDAGETREFVGREVVDKALEEAIIVFAAVGGLAAIVVLMALGHGADGATAALALAGVFLAWGSVHLMYATRYADLYYTGSAGGIDFNDDGQDAEPSYRDFLYFSYNLGMTYAVSDTDVTRTEIRSVVLRHCLLSYVFGALILATTINLVVAIVNA
ncbi:DUF1345 domain-containing protein [Nocardioides jiangxiensis]|uniref:DUF1345 domain-containing protein n=1 Tax=Nocardioides jiangxiensis TaxID=3064524 RepID=A0ABT9B189_9ACTN|nr:DUF1345 domain-containing protein [Nocardioides sp. WY-20]MDO7868079.1 DUF1345 domain-containing protein [Nocardioides sp. WY-20]